MSIHAQLKIYIDNCAIEINKIIIIKLLIHTIWDQKPYETQESTQANLQWIETSRELGKLSLGT